MPISLSLSRPTLTTVRSVAFNAGMAVTYCFFLLYAFGPYSFPVLNAVLSTVGITAFILSNRLGVLKLGKETAAAFTDTTQAADSVNRLFLFKDDLYSSNELKSTIEKPSTANKTVVLPAEIRSQLTALFKDEELRKMSSFTALESYCAERSRLIPHKVIRAENRNASIAVLLIILTGGMNIAATFFNEKKEDPSTKGWILTGCLLFAASFLASSLRSAYSVHVLNAEHERAVATRRALAAYQTELIKRMRGATPSHRAKRLVVAGTGLPAASVDVPASGRPSPAAVDSGAGVSPSFGPAPVPPPPTAGSGTPPQTALFLASAVSGANTIVHAGDGSTVHVVINVHPGAGSNESSIAGTAPGHS